MKKLIFILVLLGSPLHASITFVQAPGACVSVNSFVNSFTCTFDKPVSAGDTLIVSTMPLLTPGATTFTAIASDTVNGSFVHGVACYSAYNAQADFFYFTNSAAGSDTVTVTYTNLFQPAEMYISIAEYSGVDTSTPFDVAPTCSGDISRPTYTPYTYTGPTLDTAETTDVLISSLLVGNAGNTAVSPPYIARVPTDVAIADDTPGTAGSQAGPTWTTQYSQDGFVIGAALKSAAGGGGGGPTVVTVGPRGQYPSPCAAFPNLADGDTVQIDANGGVPYQDTSDCTIANNNLTITGVNGRPILDGSNASLAKAIWIVDGHDDAIDNFEFRNANNIAKDSSNAAGILIESSDGKGGTTPAGGNVTVDRSYIHDNFNGILSGSAGNGSGEWYSSNPFITLQYNEFANNGYGNGQTHNIYIGYGGNMDFTLQYSWSHDAYVGNIVKTRAAINNIRYNLIGDSVGNTGYLLDLPQGGSSYIVGNSLYKMATTNPNANAAMMLYADVNDNGPSDPEYGTTNQDLHFINNTVVLDPADQDNAASVPPSFVLVSCSAASSAACPAPSNGPDLTVPATMENNIFFGAETAETNQPNAFLSNNLLVPNSPAGDLASLRFNNPTAFDFRLAAGSPAIGDGMYPPTNNSGAADPNALAADEYVNPASATAWPTPSGTTMDAGAFSHAVPINTPNLNLTYSTTVQAGKSGTITVSGLPAPTSGQYNYASFLSGNQAVIGGTSSTLGAASGEGDIDSVASATTTVTATFATSAAVTSTTVVPVYVYVDGTVLTANITVTPVPAAAASIAAVSGSGQSATVGYSFANPLVVIVEDANSNPVSGVTVTFAGTGVSFPSGATATTGSNGEAQVTAQPTTTGALMIAASVAGVSAPASFSETGATGTPANIAAISGSGQSATVGTSFSSSLVVIVKDAKSNPVSGVTVSFAGGGVSFPLGATAVTNRGGEAQVTAQPTATGALTVTASVAGVSTPASFSETGVAGTAASIARVSGSGQTADIGSSFASPLVVIVKSARRAPIAGATVTFAGAGASFPAGATATTGSNGEAQVTAQPSKTGSLTITASVAGAGTPATFYETGTGGAAATIGRYSGSGQSAPVGTDFAHPLVAIVRDAWSNTVSGATVTFSGNGVSFPAGATAITGSNGEAQVTAQPTIAASLTITASAAGVSTPTAFYEVGTAATVASFTLGANPTMLAVSPGASGAVTLTVTPINGFNRPVSFACSGLPNGQACTFTPASVTPDGSTTSSTTMVISALTTASNSSPGPSRKKGRLWPFSGGGITLALCLLFFRGRRPAPALFGLVLFLCISGILAGCGGGSPFPGANALETNTVTVTATASSTTSAITQTATVTITE